MSEQRIRGQITWISSFSFIQESSLTQHHFTLLQEKENFSGLFDCHGKSVYFCIMYDAGRSQACHIQSGLILAGKAKPKMIRDDKLNELI